MWRMYPEDVIDFERIQSKMVLQNYTKDQLEELEGIYGLGRYGMILNDASQWIDSPDGFEKYDALNY